MGTGIIVCGMNGSGKSTLGRALSERLGFHFIDIEDLYFPKNDPSYLYASPRTREEVEQLLWEEIQEHEDFILASVKGDYGERLYPYFTHAVLIEVPKDIRMRRVRERSYKKFGARMLPGGDLYEEEEEFFELVKSRPEDMAEKWVAQLGCPILRVDGTKTVDEILKKCTKLFYTDNRR